MKKSLALIQSAIVSGLLLSASVISAAPWAVVTDRLVPRIATIDFGAAAPVAYGPFLQNQLGNTNNDLLAVAITPDGKKALVANFLDGAVFRVDISSPTNPVVTGCVSNSFYAEDISIAPNGQFALVTDGNMSDKMAIINLSSFTTSFTYNITSGYAQAVAIAPDNQTVLLADFNNRQLIYGIISPTGLVSESCHPMKSSLGGLNRPLNVAVAPDGQTVLVANFANEINVFQIVSPGVVVTGVTAAVTNLAPGLVGVQAITFSPAGDRAYVTQPGGVTTSNQLTWLQINSPGNVTLGGAGVASLISTSSAMFFGVDTIAMSPDGAWILADNPAFFQDTNTIALVAVSNFSVTPFNASLQMPAGVAFATTPGFTAQITVSPTNRMPLVGETTTCLISVTNSGDAVLNPVRLDLNYNTNYLAYSASSPSANNVAGGVATWTNVGPLAIGGATTVTAQFTSLNYTFPDSITNTLVTTASTAGGFALDPQTNKTTVTIANAALTADIDGDRLADLLMVVSSNWYAWFSSAQYNVRCGPCNLGIVGLPAAGDIDGDRLADLLCVVGSKWYAWFSSAQYIGRYGPYDLGITGLPATGDIDGDGLADLLMTVGSNWYVWFSTSQYLVRYGPYDFGIAGLPTTGDIDGDGLADLMMVVGAKWYVWLSTLQYLVRGGYDLEMTGLPAAGDVDGDGLADRISVVRTNWYVWFSTLNYLVRYGPYYLTVP